MTDTEAIANLPLVTTLPAPELNRLERLALLLSFARYTDEEREHLGALVREPGLDWQALAELLNLNAIRPQAYRQLVATGNWQYVPIELAGPWEAHAVEIASRNADRLATATPLFAELATAGVQVALLKGIYFAPTYYDDIGYKRMNDIDYLIRREDVDRTQAIVKSQGYFSLGLIKEGDEKQTSFSHHAPPFFHPTLRCVLGTHWGLISPLTGYKPDYAVMWSRVVPFEFLGHRHWALHPVDNLHHLCIHLPHYKTGLRELADIYNLIRAEEATLNGFDWPEFERAVTSAGTQALAFHALALVAAILPLAGVVACVARLRPHVHGFYAAEVRRRTRVPARILTARSTLTSEIDKCFGEFVLAGDFRTKWGAFCGMWGRGLWAPTDDIARFHALAPDDWSLRWRTPTMVMRVMRHGAKDLGWPIYLGLLVKLKLDLLKYAWRAVRGKEKPSKLEAAAAAHGLTRAQIEELRGLLE
jgi:hypothetical protein